MNISKVLNISRVNRQISAKESSIIKVRNISKLKTFINVPAVDYIFDDLIDMYGRLMHQFNVSMPYNFRILNPVVYGDNVRSYGVFTVKYRVGTTVKRYVLWGITQEINDDLIGKKTYLDFPIYNGELIGKNCCFEFWALSPDLVLDINAHPAFKLETSILTDPTTVNETEIVYSAGNPLYRNNLVAEDLPETVPTNQITLAWLDNVI